MALCDSCLHYRKGFDKLGQIHDDVVIETDNDKRQKHFCPMYDDHIPNDIYYDNADCEFYMNKNRP